MRLSSEGSGADEEEQTIRARVLAESAFAIVAVVVCGVVLAIMFGLFIAALAWGTWLADGHPFWL